MFADCCCWTGVIKFTQVTNANVAWDCGLPKPYDKHVLS